MPSSGDVDARLCNSKGVELNKRGDVRGALHAFREASQLDPARSRYPLQQANMHLKLGEADEALALYDTLLSGGYTLSAVEAAMCRAKRGLIVSQAPRPCSSSAVTSDAAPASLLGSAATARGRPGSPRGREKASELDREGLELNRGGDTRGALARFQAAQKLEPSNPRYLLQAANMHLKLDEKAVALRMYEALLSGTYALSEREATMARQKRGAIVREARRVAEEEAEHERAESTAREEERRLSRRATEEAAQAARAAEAAQQAKAAQDAGMAEAAKGAAAAQGAAAAELDEAVSRVEAGQLSARALEGCARAAKLAESMARLEERKLSRRASEASADEARVLAELAAQARSRAVRAAAAQAAAKEAAASCACAQSEDAAEDDDVPGRAPTPPPRRSRELSTPPPPPPRRSRSTPGTPQSSAPSAPTTRGSVSPSENVPPATPATVSPSLPQHIGPSSPTCHDGRLPPMRRTMTRGASLPALPVRRASRAGAPALNEVAE